MTSILDSNQTHKENKRDSGQFRHEIWWKMAVFALHTD